MAQAGFSAGWCSNCKQEFRGKKGDPCGSRCGGVWKDAVDSQTCTPDLDITWQNVLMADFEHDVAVCRKKLSEGKSISVKHFGLGLEIISTKEEWKVWSDKVAAYKKTEK